MMSFLRNNGLSTRRGRGTLGLQVIISALALFVFFTSCSQDRGSQIRIGVKNFEEQRILAQMAVQLLKAEGFKVDALQNCGDTYSCHQALRSKKIDLMVEYTGTGLSFMGKRVIREADSLSRVRRLYAEIGLVWLDALGFDNSYRVLVRTDRAAAKGLKTIGDLAKLKGTIRFACPSEYLRRPVDGLFSLLRTYGLKQQASSNPVIVDDPEKRFQSLLEGKVDAAIGYATDGTIQDPRLTILEDTKSFFPSYKAAFMVRRQVLKKHPKLRKILAKLNSRISTQRMRALNYKVQVEARSSERVAEAFLNEQKLSGQRSGTSEGRAALSVLIHRNDTFRDASSLALHAVRQAFPKRSVHIKISKSPREDLAQGRARLAILGAERFFLDKNERPAAQRDERVEAVAVLGARVLHLFRRKDDPRDPSSGRLGVEPKGSGGSIVGETLLKAMGTTPAVRTKPADLLKQLSNRELDGVLILGSIGEPIILQAMKKHEFKIVSLDRWITPKSRALLVYLRRARIATSTYPSQPYAVDTYSSQVVLTAPGRKLGFTGASGGQAAALPLYGLPLPRKRMKKLIEATRRPEPPDPVLPSAWNADYAQKDKQAISYSISTKFLNAGVVVFLIWIAWLIARKEVSSPRKKED